MRFSTRRLAVALAVVLAGVVLAACSSTPGSGASNTSSTPQPGDAATVAVKSGPLGDYLTDGGGRTLYLFANDKTSTSTCADACVIYWQPLTASGSPRASDGATASMLGITSRSDGSKQLTYNGHPLYYYKDDTTPGDMKGQGLNLSGGLWWVVSPNGTAIESSTPSSSPSGSDGGSDGGYGGGGGWG